MRPRAGRDGRPVLPVEATKPNGSETHEHSDGFPEAWWLPAADDVPDGYSEVGSFYETFRAASPIGDLWERGSAVFQYPNDQPAATLWYHDHALGMTRHNVYAGPAGFYLLRGGPGDDVGRLGRGAAGVLPGPA
ncbi:MAG: bilirubin oxidase, partial [Thermodesulfobacteriota bacterium]